MSSIAEALARSFCMSASIAAVGMAIAEELLAAQFNVGEHQVIDVGRGDAGPLDGRAERHAGELERVADHALDALARVDHLGDRDLVRPVLEARGLKLDFCRRKHAVIARTFGISPGKDDRHRVYRLSSAPASRARQTQSPPRVAREIHRAPRQR